MGYFRGWTFTMAKKSSMKSITLKSKVHGTHVVYFDDADDELIAKYKWHLIKRHRSLYARGRLKSGDRKLFSMHRLIMGMDNPMMVDHKDHNGLNNCRSNLRFATTSENIQNTPLTARNTTGYRGVIKTKFNRFKVALLCKGSYIYGGTYLCKKEAAKKYNELALKYFGPNAGINII